MIPASIVGARPVLTMLLIAFAPLTVAAPLPAQSNEVTLEATFVRGALGYARRTTPRALIGLELGLGVPQIDRTFVPQEDPETGEPDLEEYLHIGSFVRWKVSERFEVDTGIRAAIADLWSCSASDCLPALFGGVYVQPMVGWRRVKFGARLVAGRIWEAEEGGPGGSTFTVGLAPLLARVTFPW